MADTVETPAGEGTLEAKLEGMLDIEKFDPPEEFRKQALLNDPSVYEEAEQGLEGLVGQAGQGAALVQGAHGGARRLQPAVLQVVRGRQDQRLL